MFLTPNESVNELSRDSCLACGVIIQFPVAQAAVPNGVFSEITAAYGCRYLVNAGRARDLLFAAVMGSLKALSAVLTPRFLCNSCRRRAKLR
jgi:hypothetical protein